MTIYTLRKPKETSKLMEAHVFAAKPGAGKGCICLPKSLCQTATTAETTGLEGFMCLTGARMLVRAGEYGRGVCAECLLMLSDSEPR
jgi:hypothetical protein